MASSLNDAAIPPAEADATPDALAAHGPRNLFALALHLLVFRIGWTFKQESIILSVFLDTIAGPGWVRGFLPTLSRLGQSLPPLWWADPLKAMPAKKRSLAVFSVLAGLPYLALAWLWWRLDESGRSWLPIVFLAMHLLFFVLYGIQQLSFGTVQGKLVRPNRRGFLLWTAQLAGVAPVVLLMVWLMPQWLAQPGPGFVRIFFFAGLAFVSAGLVAGLLVEPRDTASAPGRPARDGPRRVGACFAEACRVLARDANLRLLVVVAALSSVAQLLAPHFQAFARVRFQLTKEAMAAAAPLWVVVQTIAVSTFSLALGPLADRRGYRLAMRMLILGTALTPLVALASTWLPGDLGPHWYWVVYVPQGLSPLLLLLVSNYVLETCDQPDHPRYLSTLTLCLAVPYLLSPLVGRLIDVAGFEVVFWSASGLSVLAAVLTFRLDEPRHRSGGYASVLDAGQALAANRSNEQLSTDNVSTAAPLG